MLLTLSGPFLGAFLGFIANQMTSRIETLETAHTNLKTKVIEILAKIRILYNFIENTNYPPKFDRLFLKESQLVGNEIAENFKRK